MWTKATYFADRARATGLTDRLTFEADLEAAIVFGRSALDHLRKQYARIPGFTAEEKTTFAALRGDPRCAPFLDLRDFVIHEDSAPTQKVITASVVIDVVGFVEIVDVQVIRGRPWYRRSPRILWYDLRATMRKWMKRWRKPAPRSAPRPNNQGSTTESLHFADPPKGRVRQGTAPPSLPQPFKDQPAFDVLDHWLDRIEQIVLDTETKFGIP